METLLLSIALKKASKFTQFIKTKVHVYKRLCYVNIQKEIQDLWSVSWLKCKACFSLPLFCLFKLSKNNLFYRYMMGRIILHICWVHLLELHCEDWHSAALRIIFGSSLIQILREQMKVFNLFTPVRIWENTRKRGCEPLPPPHSTC